MLSNILILWPRGRRRRSAVGLRILIPSDVSVCDIETSTMRWPKPE
jgi:hypothetical protein